jgi:hypothetical protein
MQGQEESLQREVYEITSSGQAFIALIGFLNIGSIAINLQKLSATSWSAMITHKFKLKFRSLGSVNDDQPLGHPC